MTVDEWVQEEIKRIEAFREKWRAENLKDAEIYPSEMDPGEWDEQYRCWTHEE